jgi:hypothetical protein
MRSRSRSGEIVTFTRYCPKNHEVFVESPVRDQIVREGREESTTFTNPCVSPNH